MKNNRHTKVIKKGHNFKPIILLLLIIFIVFLLILFIGSKNERTIPLRISKDNIFSSFSNSSKEFYYLQFEIDPNFSLHSLKLVDNTNNVKYSIDPNIYVNYDSKYYQLKDIINIIKQNRSENASANFIYFLDNLIGISITNYIYSYSDSKEYYSNNLNKNWDLLINKTQYNIENLNNTLDLIYNNLSVKSYDMDSNDNIIKKYNNKYRSVKIEIYNSTDIRGYGNVVSRKLINMGFGVVKVFNYDKSFPNSTLFIQNDSSQTTDIIKNLININFVKTELPSDINSISDYIIVLGGDTLQIF